MSCTEGPGVIGLLAFGAFQTWQATRVAASAKTRAALAARIGKMPLAPLLPRTRAELLWLLVLSVTACYGQSVPGDKEVEQMTIALTSFRRATRLVG